MTTDIFNGLSQDELNKIQLAQAWIVILVGGSDGELDDEERQWSKRLLQARTYAGVHDLHSFYSAVSERFNDDIQSALSSLPKDSDLRAEEIAQQLTSLNPILAKLEPSIAYGLYNGMLGLAKEVAKASGGFLRIGAISAKEQHWLKLPMLVPIEPPEGSSENADRFDENIWGESME